MTKSKDYIEEHHYFMDQLYPPTTIQVDENGNPQSYRNAYIAGQIEALKQVREKIEEQLSTPEFRKKVSDSFRWGMEHVEELIDQQIKEIEK